MRLPDYFFADLPPTASLTAQMLRESCFSLKRNREHYLRDRSTASLVQSLSTVAENWLDPEYPFRQMALAAGPGATGFSRETLTRGLETFFAQITRDRLNALLRQELGNVHRLDGMCAEGEEAHARQVAWAQGPELLVHITAGNLPVPALMSLMLGWLVRSAQFIKCARGTSLLPRLFAHSVYAQDPKLGACVELAEWPGGTAALEEVLFHEADVVTATGSDATLHAIRQRLPGTARLVGYGHRVSFGYITQDVLSRFTARQLAEAAAADVAAWNQMGCLSPQVFYVEAGGSVSPEAFAELLAGALAAREAIEPRGDITLEAATQITSLRSCFEVRALHSATTKLWTSQGSTAWTVIYEDDSRFQPSCLNRWVFVKAARDLDEVLRHAESIRGHVSTVGLAASGDRANTAVRTLARWGVTRICAIGQMQNPPLTWRHDGRPALADLVTWTNWER